MHLYGLFWNESSRQTAMWAIGRHKREAMKAARERQALIGVIKNAYGYGTPSAWDAPTFRVTMDVIADFRHITE